MFLRPLLTALVCLTLFLHNQVYAKPLVVIAANGAGNRLIEHTLPAVTLAATQDIDFLELHVVMTADDELIVYRDIILNRLTDVATLFPDRKREDGNYYVIDFALGEIQQLRLKNVFETGPTSLSLAIPTLREELGLIRRLERILQKEIGIALEIKHPWFHKNEGKDISSVALDIVHQFGYKSEDDKIYLQCFDPEELQRVHRRLMPEKQMRLPLIQLIGQYDSLDNGKTNLTKWETNNYDVFFTNIGLRMVAGFATGIGLPSSALVDQQGTLLLSQYLADVRKYGLKVFVYPVNNRAEEIPAFASDFTSLLDFFTTTVGIDGLYTPGRYAVHETRS